MNDFKTVAFFRKVELFFNHSCETVNPFFDPKWRNLLYPWWQPEILTPPVGPGLAGLVQRVIPPSLNAGKDPGKFNSHLKMYDNGVIPEN